MTSMPLQPTLFRVATTSLVIAGFANILLLWLSSSDDWFASVIAVMSGFSALMLLGAGLIAAMRPVREEALLIAFVVWVANLLEFAAETDAHWDSRLRQCGLYAGFAVLALGAYVALRMGEE